MSRLYTDGQKVVSLMLIASILLIAVFSDTSELKNILTALREKTQTMHFQNISKNIIQLEREIRWPSSSKWREPSEAP